MLHTALDGCGIKWWAGRPITETGIFNVLVSGGRCLNEIPYEYVIENGVDVDIAGCYGESLRTLVFPIGLPRVWSFTPNESHISFGQWLDWNEDDLADGLWTATVSGHLSFDQDLIFSKLAKPSDVRKANPEDDGDVAGAFCMLRKVIVNGVITADVLRTLKAVCTNNEWAEFRKLELVTAAAYLQSDKIDGLQEWCEEVLKHRGGYYTDKNGLLKDTRTPKWYAIPLEAFIGNLVTRRKSFKAKAKDITLSEAERQAAKGMDSTLKLFVNTLYGVFASRHFCIGNTILANVITGRARVGVWMTAKALAARGFRPFSVVGA
jgi:hypothetical protein